MSRNRPTDTNVWRAYKQGRGAVDQAVSEANREGDLEPENAEAAPTRAGVEDIASFEEMARRYRSGEVAKSEEQVISPEAAAAALEVRKAEVLRENNQVIKSARRRAQEMYMERVAPWDTRTSSARVAKAVDDVVLLGKSDGELLALADAMQKSRPEMSRYEALKAAGRS